MMSVSRSLIAIVFVATAMTSSLAFLSPQPMTTKAATTTTTTTNTQMNMFGFLDSVFGKTDAEVTETVYFDIDIDGKDAGRTAGGTPGVAWRPTRR